MSCDLSNANQRISARRGQVVDLSVDFLRNGALTDPYAIRFVEIYKSQVLPHNLVATIPIVDVDEISYPAPACQKYTNTEAGDCGTDPVSDQEPLPGRYSLPFQIPSDYVVPDVYFDVWYYFPDNPCTLDNSDTEETCDIDSDEYDDYLLKCCHRFWVYPDDWFCDDGLQTVRFAFEPLDQKFHTPERRPLEIGLMPLPLYDYNFNLVNPMIPFLRSYITIETQHCELLVDDDPCVIGLRHGSYRSNPWVLRYDFDTSKFLKGTYRYYITLCLPDGTTRISRKFILTIS